MGKNPGNIRSIIDVNMDRPRDRGNVEYAHITAKILKMLEEE